MIKSIEAGSIPSLPDFWEKPSVHSSLNYRKINSAWEKIREVAVRISPIAIKTIVQLGLAIAVNGLILSSAVTPLGAPITIALVAKIVLLSALPILFKVGLDIYLNWNKPKEEAFEAAKKDLFWKGAQNLTGFSLVNAIGLAGPIPLIHEMGHAAAAQCLFVNPRPEIKIRPFQGGATDYYVSRGLTKLGKLLGKENSILCVTAAGMAGSTLFGMVEIAIAHLIGEKHPEVSQWMTYHAVAQILNDVVYGITSFMASRLDLTHDFIRLWNLGSIHPLIPIALMVALPLIEIAILKIISLYINSRKVNEVSMNHFSYELHAL